MVTGFDVRHRIQRLPLTRSFGLTGGLTRFETWVRVGVFLDGTSVDICFLLRLTSFLFLRSLLVTTSEALVTNEAMHLFLVAHIVSVFCTFFAPRVRKNICKEDFLLERAGGHGAWVLVFPKF